MSIKSKTIQDGRIAIIEIRGSFIGNADTDRFREDVDDFIEQGNKNLVINLQKVDYINSSGIGAIISARGNYQKENGMVKLVGVSRNVQNLLVVTRLIEIFEVYETLDEAVLSFNSSNQQTIKQSTI